MSHSALNIPVMLTKEESLREALDGEAGASPRGRSVVSYALRRIGFAGDAAAGMLPSSA
ncbi:MAG: hypothetical protein H0W06_11750 [Chloroflexia bacterium]|nr:hypothetical protein [Chloroflexia bacterium]